MENCICMLKNLEVDKTKGKKIVKVKTFLIFPSENQISNRA